MPKVPNPAKPKPNNSLANILLDPKKTAETRAKILQSTLQSMPDPGMQQTVLIDLFQQMITRSPETQVNQMRENYEQILNEMEYGPVRPATFVAEEERILPSPTPRVLVVTPDGQQRYPTLNPKVDLKLLKPGMTVYLDHRGTVVLGAAKNLPTVGQEGTFIRHIADTHLIETQLQNDRMVVYAAAPVLEAIATGKVKNGDKLLVCSRRQFAFAVVPSETDYRYRFVDNTHVPDVVIERDVGKPHWVLDYMLRKLRLLLFREDLLKQFDLRPRFSVLLTGPSGCGKTLTIRAVLHEFNRMLMERTGREDLGSRVVRVKGSELLSEWLGRTDKNIEDLFNDIRSIASTPVETTSGEKLLLPVVVIMEEIEGITRRRGHQDAGVYDRLLTTFLQRLDDTTDDLSQLPLLFISTSNRPDLIDSAMRRRLGVQAKFTRLDEEGFAAILDKKLKPHYPYASDKKKSPEEVRKTIVHQMVRWLFGPNRDNQGLVEITLREGRKLIKFRRDFLTGAVIEQAISSAIDQTVTRAEETGNKEVGLDSDVVLEALRQHIDGLAENMTPHNVADYLDLPENAQVMEIRRMRNSEGQLSHYLLDLLDN